jgi:hypothetical protein
LAQDCHGAVRFETGVGFPEFESIHLTDFSTKAQLSKSVASTIPPRPLAGAYLVVIPLALMFYLKGRWYTAGSVERTILYGWYLPFSLACCCSAHF